MRPGVQLRAGSCAKHLRVGVGNHKGTGQLRDNVLVKGCVYEQDAPISKCKLHGFHEQQRRVAPAGARDRAEY